MSGTTNTKENLTSTLPEEALCPSCGKFAGAYERCPHCQASISMRISLKIVRRVAVWGSIIGVIMLWFAARNWEVPDIKIENISIENNMALVKITGKVTQAKIDKEKNNMTLTVDDGTGNMKISAYNQLKRFQKAFPSGLPKVGDQIEATGNLSISDTWGASMFLSSPKRLKLLGKTVVKERMIEELTQDDVGDVFKMKLQVTSVRKQKSGHSLMVKDSTGSMYMILWDSILNKVDKDMQDKLITEGNVFEMLVQVGQYKGKLQLSLADADKISFIEFSEPEIKKKIPTAVAANIPEGFTAISAIEKGMMYSYVRIQAKVNTIKGYKTGSLLTVEDASGSINVWAIKDVFEKANISEGDSVSVRAKVDLFKSTLQLSADENSEIKKVEIKPEFSSGGNITVIEKINPGMVGETVTVCGTVEKTESFKTGHAITISDGSAPITVWISENVAKYLDIPKVSGQGTKLQITAVVSKFKDQVQLTVKNSKFVTIQ